MFDWTKVEGYREDMSAEEKLALLDNYEAPKDEPDEQDKPGAEPKPGKGFVSKAQFDKVSSELAAAKKQLRSRMSEDEQREADRQAQAEAMETELKELRHEKTVSSYKASFLSRGFDEKMADDAANAMADGDMETVFALMGKQSANAEKALRAKILKETPVPPAGDNPDNKDEKDKRMEDIMRKSMGLPPRK